MQSFAVVGTITALVIVGLIVFVFYRLGQGQTWLVSGPLGFLAIQVLFTIGLIQHVDWTDAFDTKYLTLTIAGLAVFTFGVTVANEIYRVAPRREFREFRSSALIDDITPGRIQVLLVLLFISVLIAIEFQRRVGYNSFRIALEQFINTGSVDRASFSNLRNSATHSQYVAAGYAVQFTAVILPTIAILIFYRGMLRRDPKEKVLSGALMLVSIYTVTVVGGRQYLVQIGVTFLLLASRATTPFARNDRPSRSVVRVVLIGLILLYGVATLLQGRLSDEPAGHARIGEVFGNAYNRVSGDYSAYQLEAIKALRSEAPVMGQEWARTLQTVLPGPTKGLTFDQRVHALLFSGNTRGNSPLGFFGSAYYNWGPIGLLLLSFCIGVLLQAFTIRCLLRRPKTLSRVVLLSAASVRFALIRDPYSLLLEGGLTLVFVYWLEQVGTRRETGGRSRYRQRDMIPGHSLLNVSSRES